MKTGIITLFGEINYGNRLQNYAVSRLLQKYGGVETIVIQSESNIKKTIREWFLNRWGVAFRHKIPYRMSMAARERRFRFVRFTEKHIPLRYYKCSSFTDMQKLERDYACFVTGSDQVWNPFFWGDAEADRLFNLYFLAFAPDGKRIAFSASIGINTLPEKWKGKFSEEWKKFRAISVREDRGAEIIRECCQIDVPVLIDPTLALSKEEWMSVSDPDVRLPGRYALLCFLGNKTDEYQKMIHAVIEERKLDCVELNNEDCPEYYRLGPDGFLTAVERADIVFTDSFHAAVFSIIFEKPFITFDRLGEEKYCMNSRMNTLFGKLGMKGRMYGGENGFDIDIGSLFSFDYTSVKRHLKEEQNIMRDYLDNVFLTGENHEVKWENYAERKKHA